MPLVTAPRSEAGEAPAEFAVRAPAKLNLSLAVLARRGDGFHEIESLIVPVTLHDTVAVRVAGRPGIRLRVRFAGGLATAAGRSLATDVPTDATNLVVRAAAALAAEAGIASESGDGPGLDIDLVKRIPSGSGLGGGSSDAAAVLVAAARAWGIDWPRERLANLAARLGSDVPIFLVGGPAIASGRGEALVPVVGIPPLAAVIACPAAGLSTAAVYAKCAPAGNRRGLAQRLASALVAGDLRGALDTMHNDLEPPARALSADVVRLLEALSEAGAVRPLLTGSGSACFALARTAAEAQGIAARLEASGWPGVFAVQLATART
jgi:4-diphosphocytidyl-2-C-methyl-D-erythritol kinase